MKIERNGFGFADYAAFAEPMDAPLSRADDASTLPFAPEGGDAVRPTPQEAYFPVELMRYFDL